MWTRTNLGICISTLKGCKIHIFMFLVNNHYLVHHLNVLIPFYVITKTSFLRCKNTPLRQNSTSKIVTLIVWLFFYYIFIDHTKNLIPQKTGKFLIMHSRLNVNLRSNFCECMCWWRVESIEDHGCCGSPTTSTSPWYQDRLQ